MAPVLGDVITTAPGGVPRLTVIVVELVVPNEFVQLTPMVLAPVFRLTEPLVAAPAAWFEVELAVVLLIVHDVLAGTVLAPPTV